MRGIFILAISAALQGCSVYQSDGRKQLEKNAVGIATASANLVSCQHEPMSKDWLKIAETESANVFASEKTEFALKVVPHAASQSFNCAYQFSSAQEMTERMDSAIEIAILELGQSLGSFAFPPISNLK